MHDLERLKKIDERGLKHRLREKTIAEENLRRLENRVGQDFALHQNFVKINNVTELENKAFVADTASLNSEKLKGRFHLRINHGLNMSKKIEMYANDNVAFLLHKGRNFLYKLEKEEEKMKVEMARQQEEDRKRRIEEDKRRQQELERQLLEVQREKDAIAYAAFEIPVIPVPEVPEEGDETRRDHGGKEA